jgi:hypothetical protein
MVRKLGELPKFLVFNSRTKSFENSSVFAFYLLLSAFRQNSIFALWAFDRGLVTLLCLRFRWSGTITLTFTSPRMGDCIPKSAVWHTHLPWLRRGCSGLPLSTVQGSCLDRCEVSVTIPHDPMHPWSGSIVGSEPNTGVEMMAHITLSSLCEDRLAATATLPITLPPIQIRRTPYGSNALRLCPILRALTSTWGWLRRLGMHNTYSTASTTPPGPSCSSVCVW